MRVCKDDLHSYKGVAQVSKYHAQTEVVAVDVCATKSYLCIMYLPY